MSDSQQINAMPIPEEIKQKPIEHDSFNPFDVALNGSNLIEASAGTGKTYSIAVLTLRLILESGIKIDQILMVTFTRDATAEMKLRVRQFLRDALQAARALHTAQDNFDGLDKKIVALVRNFNDKVLAIERLQDALLQFDKAAIFTIHGFCARILGEHAFESNSLFQTKTLDPADFNEYVEDVFNQAWREEVTILEEEILLCAYSNEFSRERILRLVKDAVGGKKIYFTYNNDGEHLSECLQRIKEAILKSINPDIDLDLLNSQLVDLREPVYKEIFANRASWIAQAKNDKNKNCREKIPVLLEKPVEDILNEFSSAKDRQYIKDFFPSTFLLQINSYYDKGEEIKKAIKEISKIQKTPEILIPQLVSLLAKIIFEKIESKLVLIKEKQGEATYDDLIIGMHEVICNEGPQNQDASHRLIQVLRNRYNAVFIDEFQDTDRHQFEIFHKVYGNTNNHILFFIGDPKQSIYGFRKADLETYFKAAKEVDDIWRMNTNYRSTPQYVQAMNEFFKPDDDFNVFQSDKMKYHKVNTPTDARAGGLVFDQSHLQPMRIVCCESKKEATNKAIHLVRQLLQNPALKIKINDQLSPIQAGQIGILVRKKSEGKMIRERLSRLGIPAVTVSDTKIFETQEAKDVYYILSGVYESKTGSINRALITKIAGLSFAELNLLHADKLIEKFRSYQNEWKMKGVYQMLRMFLSDCRAINRKQDGCMENADRILANTIQLMEMLHEAETDNKLSPEELISWLKKGIDGEQFSEDEYLQRIESDEVAVKIVTMHSCKGLEYDIVIAPYLDMEPTDKHKTANVRLDSGYYVADKKTLSDADKLKARNQTKEENLRLLYVAITRARYHCYMLLDHSKKDTSLTGIQKAIIDSKTIFEGIRFIGNTGARNDIKDAAIFDDDQPELSEIKGWVKQPKDPIQVFAELPNIAIPDYGWQKTSYSKLNLKQDPLFLTHEEPGEDAYDQFIFRKMRKGAQTGNFLHDIFEHMDFTTSDSWKYPLRSALNRYPGTGVKLDEHKELMHQLLEHVTGAHLPTVDNTSFSLNTIPRAARLNELEFDLPLSSIDWKLVPHYVDEQSIPIRINRESTITGGILNGKVDLFFEKDGRYYILDWKSNHLGNRAEDYHADAMATAMEEHNYYLQYYLYCLALYRYLQTRISGFDYETQFGGVYYLFVRGMRKDQPHGIYFHKPQLKDLLMLEKAMLKERV